MTNKNYYLLDRCCNNLRNYKKSVSYTYVNNNQKMNALATLFFDRGMEGNLMTSEDLSLLPRFINMVSPNTTLIT